MKNLIIFFISIVLASGCFLIPTVADAHRCFVRCFWVQGHWRHGFWIPAHKVCHKYCNKRCNRHGCWWK